MSMWLSDGVHHDAGDVLHVVYNDGMRLNVYLPETDIDAELCIASDGSTYWDAELTQLVQAT